MHLTATGQPVASVPFSHKNQQFELLVGEDARLARRRVAWQTLQEMLTKTAPHSQKRARKSS